MGLNIPTMANKNILQGILVSFLPEERGEIEKCRDDEIVEKLLQIQQNSKYFVILDDRDVWECIKVAFPTRKKGNKILLTTRNKNVPIHIGPHGYHHEPRLLTEAESWELLRKKALRDQPSQVYGDIHNLEELGKEMVKFCEGLQLAVVVLGGILATKESFREWTVVCKNVRPFLGKGESIKQREGEVQKILALSYSDLPYKLKPCFLYLSGFSEDEDIEVDRLCHLWIAEGMVLAEDKIGNESIMEVAERYLGELGKRCIVTLQAMEMDIDDPSFRSFSSCGLHDLMRDLCRAKAREENFLRVIDYGHGNENQLADSFSSTTRNFPRIIIYLSEKDVGKYAPIEMEEGKHLRTIEFFATERGDLTAQLAKSQFNRFKMLRSLTIEGVITQGVFEHNNKYHFPKGVLKSPIGNLIHLRCLRLRNSKLVMSPSSISNLEHLETLDMRGSKIMFTKNAPVRVRRLRHLYLTPESTDIPLKFCVSNDLEVVSGIHYRYLQVAHLSELTNLREISTSRCEFHFFEDIEKCVSNSQHIKDVCIWINTNNSIL